MSVFGLLQRLYHAAVPISVRQKLRLTRFTASRRARATLWRRTGGRVAAGAFRGELLFAAAPDDCYGAALIGAYESETHPWLERQFARGWRVIVNIGSSEGYYSTGLALRLPAATVHAFEMDADLRKKTGESAARNGVGERVVLHGIADVASLAALPAQSALVVCDCEGAERELIDPVAVPWMARSAILVELHDFYAPGVTELLRGRFSATHDIEIVSQGPRDAADWARRAEVPVAHARQLIEELRDVRGAHVDGRWMLLTPRA
jgi:hypothetical protein